MEGGGDGNGGGGALESSRGRSGMRTAVAAAVGCWWLMLGTRVDEGADDNAEGFLNAFFGYFWCQSSQTGMRVQGCKESVDFTC